MAIRTQLVLLVAAFAGLVAGALGEDGATGEVFVAGASGRTGGYILFQLEAQGYRNVVGLSRDAERAASDQSGSWRWVEGDVRDPERMKVLVGDAQYVICTIGAPARSGPLGPEFVDYGGVRNLVDAAKAAGVRHFVLISSAAAGPYRGASRMNRFGNVRYWKTRGEDYLKTSGLDYTIIGPGGLLRQKCCRDGVRVLSRKDYDTGMIAMGDVARIAVDALSNPDARNKTFAVIRDESLEPGDWRRLLSDLGGDEPTSRSDAPAPAESAR